MTIRFEPLQYLFEPVALTDFSGAVLGLEENKEILERQLLTAKIATYISGFTFAAVSAAFVFTNIAIMPEVFAITAVGTAAVLIYQLYLNTYVPEAIEYNKKLLEAFHYTTQGDHQLSMGLLNQLIKPHLLGHLMQGVGIEPEYEFIEGVSEGFAYLDLKYSSVSQDRSEYMLASLFAHVALMNAFQTMKQASGPNEPTDVVFHQLCCDVSRANRFTNHQGWGTRSSEHAAYRLFEQTKDQIKSSPELAQIGVPQRISIGHGLMIKMIEQLSYLSDLMFDSQGNLYAESGKGNLQTWKIHLNKIKKQFERDHLDTDFDRHLIERLLQAHTMRECWQVIRTISDSEIEALKGRFVQYRS